LQIGRSLETEGREFSITVKNSIDDLHPYRLKMGDYPWNDRYIVFTPLEGLLFHPFDARDGDLRKFLDLLLRVEN
jgi:hypothetical protein